MVTEVRRPSTQPRNQTTAAYKRRVASLVNFWQVRNDQFKKAYKRLRLDDNLRQPQMESFITNDPKTLYNLALYLLTSSPAPHNIPQDQAPPELSSVIAQVERIIEDSWSILNRESRDRGQQNWLQYLTKLMLATGWYAVFCLASDEGLVADIWNPAETYPEYSDGLSAVAHTYRLSASAARKKVQDKGWTFDVRGDQSVEVLDFWEFDDQGTPTNTIILNTTFVKPPTPHPEFTRIPVYISPVAGLPDNGAIDQNDEDWKRWVGESIVATNEQVYENYNRQHTFLQQILRDTAQPRFKERSRSRNILSPETIFRRGAIFRMDIDEDVGVIDMPSVPPELRTQLFDIEGMIQRGGFPFALYGNVSGEVAGFVMSQIAASATQILKPYRDAISNLLSDIDNFWLQMIRDNGIRPREVEVPQIPPALQFAVDLRIQIPGDLALRASTARQLNPTYSLSESTVTDLLFPEVRNPAAEQAQRQRDQALSNPIMGQITLSNALRQEASLAIQAGDRNLANLFLNAATVVEAQINQAATAIQGQQQPQPTGPSGPGVNLT